MDTSPVPQPKRGITPTVDSAGENIENMTKRHRVASPERSPPEIKPASEESPDKKISI
jgi:hypothetical protein